MIEPFSYVPGTKGTKVNAKNVRWYKEILIFAYVLRESEILFVFCVSTKIKSKQTDLLVMKFQLFKIFFITVIYFPVGSSYVH
jgi:hypothetical protein